MSSPVKAFILCNYENFILLQNIQIRRGGKVKTFCENFFFFRVKAFEDGEI